MFEPMMRMQSAFCRSCWKVVAPPRPKDVPKLGTVDECHMRAWFSIWSAAERGIELLQEVVLLVVEGRAPRCAKPSVRCSARPWSSVSSHVCARVAITRSAIMSIAVSSGRSVHSVAYGARYLTRSSRFSVTSERVAEPFGHNRPREIGLSGSPSMSMICSSRTNTCCPHPTAQYGHTDFTTRCAEIVRGAIVAERPERADAPRPSKSACASCCATGHFDSHDAISLRGIAYFFSACSSAAVNFGGCAFELVGGRALYQPRVLFRFLLLGVREHILLELGERLVELARRDVEALQLLQGLGSFVFFVDEFVDGVVDAALLAERVNDLLLGVFVRLESAGQCIECIAALAA